MKLNSINFKNFDFLAKNFFFENNHIFRSFTNWHFFVFILLGILCWFRICHFFHVYFNIFRDIDIESLSKIPKMPFFGQDSPWLRSFLVLIDWFWSRLLIFRKYDSKSNLNIYKIINFGHQKCFWTILKENSNFPQIFRFFVILY